MSLSDKNDPRVALDQLIRERGEDYASLSRMLGRNTAYIQQFIKRGVPRKLDETDRRQLARYFGVPEQLLGGLPDEALKIVGGKSVSLAKHGSDMVLVPYVNAEASAGHGALAVDERITARVAFRGDLLRELAGGDPSGLSVIRVRGDSMLPMLADGDDILVDRNDSVERLRDGIYVIRVDDMLNVKRIAKNPKGGGFEVRSDNPAYPTWSDCDTESVTIIGRVVWKGQRIS